MNPAESKQTAKKEKGGKGLFKVVESASMKKTPTLCALEAASFDDCSHNYMSRVNVKKKAK